MIMVHAVVARRDVCESLRGRLVAREVLSLVCERLREYDEVDHAGGRVAQSSAMLLVCASDDLADPQAWVQDRITAVLHERGLATAWSARFCRRISPPSADLPASRELALV